MEKDNLLRRIETLKNLMAVLLNERVSVAACVICGASWEEGFRMEQITSRVQLPGVVKDIKTNGGLDPEDIECFVEVENEIGCWSFWVGIERVYDAQGEKPILEMLRELKSMHLLEGEITDAVEKQRVA